MTNGSPTAPAARFRAKRLRPLLLAAILLLAVASLVRSIGSRYHPGCSDYPPIAGTRLIAHAGGGLAHRTYPNSLAAMDLSYAHGLRMFELDFHELPFGLVRTGHDPIDILDWNSAWLGQVIGWFRAHPDAVLVTDFKTDNGSGLARVAAAAPDLRHRIWPYVYEEREYPIARRLGFDRPIFAIYHNHERDWLDYANSHGFAAVAIPSTRLALVPRIRRPVFVHVLDQGPVPNGVTAVVTNCLRPARA